VAGGKGGSGAWAASAAPTWSAKVMATCRRSALGSRSDGACMTKWPTTSPNAHTGRASSVGPRGTTSGGAARHPLRSTTGTVGPSGSALKAHDGAPSTAWSSRATDSMKTATSAPDASSAAASRTRPRSTLAAPSVRLARAARMASSPVNAPTTTKATAVATSLCFTMAKRSYGWVSKKVNAIAPLAVAPSTAAWRRQAPAAVVTTTRARATMASLCPLRNGTHNRAIAAAAAAPATKAARDVHRPPGAALRRPSVAAARSKARTTRVYEAALTGPGRSRCPGGWPASASSGAAAADAA
jgi:hypothetical protein